MESSKQRLVDELSILYAYCPEDKRTLIFNYFILLGKRHIFAQRFEQKTPNIDLFFDFVKGELIVHKCIFQSTVAILKQVSLSMATSPVLTISFNYIITMAPLHKLV